MWKSVIIDKLGKIVFVKKSAEIHFKFLINYLNQILIKYLNYILYINILLRKKFKFNFKSVLKFKIKFPQKIQNFLT
jgi:hypothetical protein